MKSTATASILIVEDEARQLRYYTKTLGRYQLTCVPNGTAALAEMSRHIPDLIILDHVLAGGEYGTDFVPRLKAIAAHVPILIISGTLEIRGQLAALQGPLAAHYVLEKPVDLDELDATVQRALAECGVGETVQMLQALEKAEKIDCTEPERRFTERLARQHEMIKRLREATAKPSVSQLARDFQVSRKTIRRDLSDLIQRGQLDATVYPEAADSEVDED